MAKLSVRNISKWFPHEIAAVDDLSLDVEPHELVVVLGPSGCGKSTLLKIIAGLELPTAGQILIDDRDVTAARPDKRSVGMVFQGENLLPHLSVHDNLRVTAGMRGLSRTTIEARIATAQSLLGLSDLLDRFPAELSGGERQRVAIGRLLVEQPAIALLDEPLSSLDPHRRDDLRRAIRQVQQQAGLTMVYVTHDQSEALALGDRVAVMRDGRVAQVGTPHEIYGRPSTRFVAGFLGSPPMNLLRLSRINGVISWQGLVLPPPTASDLVDGGGLGDLWCGIRSEALQVYLELPGQLDADQLLVEGIVRDRAYQGDHVRLAVQCDKDLLQCKVAEPGMANPGDRVFLAFHRDDLRYFSAD